MAKPIAKPRFTKTENKKWEGGGRYQAQRKFCTFCADKAESVDYKDAIKLRRYISDRGKIEPRRRTGTCAKHQRALALAIKKARLIALLPYTALHVRKMGIAGPIAPQVAAPVEERPVAAAAAAPRQVSPSPAAPITPVTEQAPAAQP